MDKQIKSDRQTLLRMIELNERAANELIAKHGTGVRPSWVSGELAYHWDWVAHYKQQLAELDALEDDGFTTIVPEVK